MPESGPAPLDLTCNPRVLEFLIGTELLTERRKIFLHHQGLRLFNLSNECDLIGIPSLLSGTHQLHISKIRKRVVEQTTM